MTGDYTGVQMAGPSGPATAASGPRCSACGVYYFNAEHTCLVYDGPPCSTCGEPTIHYTYGAPGIGGGDECRRGHRTNDTGRVLRPWETK